MYRVYLQLIRTHQLPIKSSLLANFSKRFNLFYLKNLILWFFFSFQGSGSGSGSSKMLVARFGSSANFTKQMPVQVRRISTWTCEFHTPKGEPATLVLPFEHLILVWHNFLEFSYQPHPGIKSNIDFWLVQGKSTPDIEIGINLIQRLVFITLGPSPYQGGITLGHISFVGSLIPVLRVGAVIYIYTRPTLLKTLCKQATSCVSLGFWLMWMQLDFARGGVIPSKSPNSSNRKCSWNCMTKWTYNLS